MQYTRPGGVGAGCDYEYIITPESNLTDSSDAEHLPKTTNALTDYSPSDAPWDTHRGQTDDVAGIYAASVKFERYAERMESCSGRHKLGRDTCQETGETTLRLRQPQLYPGTHCHDRQRWPPCLPQAASS